MKLNPKDATRFDLDCSNETLEAEITRGLWPTVNAKVAYRQMRALERLADTVEIWIAKAAVPVPPPVDLRGLNVPSDPQLLSALDVAVVEESGEAAPSDEPAPRRRERRA